MDFFKVCDIEQKDPGTRTRDSGSRPRSSCLVMLAVKQAVFRTVPGPIVGNQFLFVKRLNE